jgi:TRIAD3 protein (E3 ubiquitin-protein ligase RNF216)
MAPIDVDNSHLPEPPVLEQAYWTELDSDPVSACVAHILEIIPDVEPDYLTRLVTKAVSTHGSRVLEHVLHFLFDDSKYPKIDAKGKGKRKRADDEDKDAQAEDSKRPKVDFGYGDLSRAFKGGPDYLDIALVWNSSHHDMYSFRSKAGTSTRRFPFPPEGVSERIS